MNFADINTCLAIATEFPNSEFVWAYNGVCQAIYARRDMIQKWILLAPAPTCEELGRYMAGSKHFQYDKLAAVLFDCCLSEDETQARAEAVKLILEQKK